MENTDHGAQDYENIRYSRVPRPHRSSSERAVKIVTGFVLCLFIPTGTVLLLVGAWPVFGFMGLEVIALILALRYNHKVGSAFEAITITDKEFRHSKVSHWGKRKLTSFQPQWLQVRIDEASQQLIAGIHGKRVIIGKFLTDDEREELCNVLIEEIRRLGDVRHNGA
jgi:uncharacterized membrane protein